MHLGDLGEFGLIHRFAPLFSTNLPVGVEGIGNDCAVIPLDEENVYLATTDLLIENTHFIKTLISPGELGYKSLAVNLSDIAAMGGQPKFTFLSLGLPKDTPIEWIDTFFSSFKQLCNETNVLLLGGDTTRSSLIVINVLILGVAKKEFVKRRSQAIPGDVICCTGYLGDSGGGLKIILENLPRTLHAEKLIKSHYLPQLQLKEGAWLAKQDSVHAMMDISDGLASDIQRIMEESRCGAMLEIERLPLSPELKSISETYGWSAEHIALTGGEDYCLLLTVDPPAFPYLSQAFATQFHKPLYPLGTILPNSTLIYTLDQKPYELLQNGYDHFKSI